MRARVLLLGAIALFHLGAWTQPGGCIPEPLDPVLVTDTPIKTDVAAATPDQPILGGLSTSIGQASEPDQQGVGPLLRAISTEPAGGVAPMQTSFAAEFNGPRGRLEYAWDFGDGETSARIAPTHLFAEPGLYDVRLTVIDANGGADTRSLTVPVIPVHTIVVGEQDTLTVPFAAETLQPLEWLSDAEYQWDFGDRTVAAGQSVSHTFRHAGVYRVVLSLTIAGITIGCDSRDVEVAAPSAPQAPVAHAGDDLSVTDEDGDGSASVLLNALNSYDPDGTITRYRWTENGSVIYRGRDAWITVDLAVGTHVLELTVTDDDGQQASDSVSVTVRANATPPVADAGPDQTVPDADGDGSEPVTLDASGSNSARSIITYRWSENDVELSSGQNAVQQITLADGVHVLRLDVTDEAGNSASDTTTVTITEPPSDCTRSGPSWDNQIIAPITGSATIEFDATPNAANIDGLTCFSQGNAAAYADTAVAVRFNVSGTIDARNGDVYSADTNVSYTAGTSYHFRIAVNVPNRSYSVWVTPAGGSEIVLATNYAFRTQQSGITQLDTCNLNSSIGDHDTCNLTVRSGGNQPPTADAGFDRSVNDADNSGSENITLDGSGSSDPDGQIVNYRWTEGPTVLADGASATPAVTLTVGTHTIQLTVTDDAGDTASDTVTITVSAAAGTTMTSSVSQYGITWTFDREYPVGQFVTGDYYVVGPATVVSVSPGPSNGRNGSMINPEPGFYQAYDSRWQYYDASRGVSFPVTLQPNQSLVSTISQSGNGPFTDLMGMPISASHTYLKTAAVLTCLSSAVPSTTFRPPLAGDAKPLYDSASMRRDLLPALTPTSGALTVDGSDDVITRYARFFQRPWLLHQWDWLGRMIHPTDNMPNYHREMYALQSDAALLVLCNYANRDELLIPYVQVGIDSYYVAVTGQGENTLHKWNVIFAGLMLDDTNMQHTSYNYRTDFMTYRAGTGSSPNGDPTVSHGWTGATILWRQRPGDLEHEHLDPTDWGVVPSGGGIKREAYRRSNSYVWPGACLAARIMGAQGLWNHDEFFEYVDRWMTEPDEDNMAYLEDLWSYQLWIPGGSTNSSFISNMWSQYRSQY